MIFGVMSCYKSKLGYHKNIFAIVEPFKVKTCNEPMSNCQKTFTDFKTRLTKNVKFIMLNLSLYCYLYIYTDTL